MFRPRNLTAPRVRRAVILMIVLVLLTLFAIVGLAFVLYANAEAESSRVYREAFTLVDNRPDISPDILANWSVGQLMFDVPEPIASAANPLPTARFSALRGHSLGRDIYGWNSDLPGSNIYPFNGIGHLHSTDQQPLERGRPHSAQLRLLPNDPNASSATPSVWARASLSLPMQPYTGGWNSSYTYPDGNHVFLGAFDADCNVLARSFWRPYLLPQTLVGANPSGNVCLPLNPSDANYWTWFADHQSEQSDRDRAALPDATLRSGRATPTWPSASRPRPRRRCAGIFHQRRATRDSGNDSVWMDLDYPVQMAGDGTKFKPLFAFFIADLDGRVNFNTHGNIRGTGDVSLSDQGWGKWEVNVSAGVERRRPSGRVAGAVRRRQRHGGPLRPRQAAGHQ